MKEFKDLGLSKDLLSVITDLGFTKPSEIQEKSIPLILKGNDVIGNASTGSGKTLAFASGIIEKVSPGGKVQALVLTPTRELAEQITKVMRVFAKKTKLKVQDIYGGVGFDNQIRGAKESEIIIGTPGRILDHLQRETLDFFDLNVLVLDEADRMADMGFLQDVEKIIGQCPKKRQTLLFSATTSQDVDYIAKKYMIDPKYVTVEKYVDPSKLKQFYYDAPSHLKFSLLVHLLKAEKSGIIMVFCNTRRNVDLVGLNLQRYNLNSITIHGGLEQKKRSRMLEQFHKNEANILICTDVAARGLDIKGVTHVYNYDSPKTSEEYIHRIGRTARAGEKGMAISIVSSRDYENFRKVVEDDSLKIELKELPKIEKLNPNFNNPKGDFRAGSSRYGGRSSGFRSGGNRGRGYSGNRGEGSGHRHSGGSGGGKGRRHTDSSNGKRYSGGHSGSRRSFGSGRTGNTSGGKPRGRSGNKTSRRRHTDNSRKHHGGKHRK